MRTKRQPTEAKKQQAAERREKFKLFCQRVAALSEDQRAQLAAQMPIINPDGHALSAFNSCLIVSQFAGTPTVVAGFQQWRRVGRQVRKGESGLMIWVPIGKKNKPETNGDTADDTSKPGFILGYVWDLSQTDAIEAA